MTEPIRCVIDTVNDPHEISLDENITREVTSFRCCSFIRRFEQWTGWLCKPAAYIDCACRRGSYDGESFKSAALDWRFRQRLCVTPLTCR